MQSGQEEGEIAIYETDSGGQRRVVDSGPDERAVPEGSGRHLAPNYQRNQRRGARGSDQYAKSAYKGSGVFLTVGFSQRKGRQAEDAALAALILVVAAPAVDQKAAPIYLPMNMLAKETP